VPRAKKSKSKKSFLEVARHRALIDGLLGGDRRWLVLGGLAWGIRAIGAATRNEERVVYRGHLRPGEQLVISESQPAERARRKR
jgi:hypothetical protein